MKDARVCGQCGAEVTGYSAEGLCPQCMLLGGLAIGGEGGIVPEKTYFIGATDLMRETKLRYFGDYELLEEIARGGMGVVYKARQVTLNRIVAVKMILSGQLANAAALQRFMAEAEAAANLRHPNIVAIYEVGEHEGEHYFSMEYVEGQNLAALVREKPLPAARAAEYVRLIAEAIQYAHDRGTLHRDLKPSNVLLDSFDQPRITDFGLAKQVESDSDLTVSGQVLGTPSFMPPEQAAGRRSDMGPAADVYSLGAILYYLVAGRPPFVSGTVMDTLRLVAESEPVSPRLLNPGVPRDLETICLKCLEKEPASRYPTAQALADELGRFLRDEPIQARPVNMPEKLWRSCKRKPAIAGLFAALGFSLVLGFLGVLWQWKKAVAAREIAQANEERANGRAKQSSLLSRFLMQTLQQVGPSVARGRDTTMLREILDKAAERIDREFKDFPGDEANLRGTLAEAYFELGEYAKAETMSRECVRLNRLVDIGEDEELAKSLDQLCKVVAKRGDLGGAEAAVREELTLEKKLKGETSESFAHALNSLGVLLISRGNLSEAELRFRESLAIRQKIHCETNAELARLLGNTALVCGKLKNWGEAELMAREGIAIYKRLFGEKCPEVMWSLSVLGNIVQWREDLPQAEAVYREVVSIGNEIYGETHPETTAQLGNLLNVLNGQGKWLESEAICRQWLDRERKLQPDDASAVDSPIAILGYVLFQRGKLDEAEQMWRESLAFARKSQPSDPQMIGERCQRLAEVLTRQEKYDEAEQMRRESLALARESQPADPIKVEYRCNMLAELLKSQEKYEQAEPLWRELVKSRQARLPAESDEVDQAQVSLAMHLTDFAWKKREPIALAKTSKNASREKVGETNSLGACALEAELIERRSFELRLKNHPDSKWFANSKWGLGGALVSVAATDWSLSAENRLSKLAEAENLLLDASDRLLTDKEAQSWWKRSVLERLCRLYETWNQFAPDTGKAEKITEWKQKLADFDGSAISLAPEGKK